MPARALLGAWCGAHWGEATRGSPRSASVTAPVQPSGMPCGRAAARKSTVRIRRSPLSDPRPGLEVLFALRIVIEELEVEDVVAMYAESRWSNQAIRWPGFKDGDLPQRVPKVRSAFPSAN